MVIDVVITLFGQMFEVPICDLKDKNYEIPIWNLRQFERLKI